MQAVSAIFDWVLLSSVTGSVLVLLILGAKYIFKNNLGTNWHYYIWFLLLLKLIVPFTPESPVSIYNIVKLDPLKIVGGSHIDNTAKDYQPAETKDYRAGSVSGTTPKNLHSEPVKRGPGIDGSKVLMLRLWLIGVALLALYTIFVNLRLWYQVRTEPRASDSTITNIIENCRSEMKIDRHIPVKVSGGIGTPALCGLISPVLLLPRGFIQNLDEKEIQYIVLHELIHYKRKDILVNWLAVMARIIHWFNPVIWFGLYRMHLDSELACDAQVLSLLPPGNYKEYGKTIIRVLEMTHAQQWIPGVSHMLTPKSNIRRRISMISSFKRKSMNISIITVIVFIVIGVVGCTAANNNTDTINSNNRGDQELQLLADLKTNQMMAGTIDVEGQGIAVTLAVVDSKADKSQQEDTIVRVHDADILNIVNELIVAGAEAISVNDERLNNSSGIICQGTHITVNGKPCDEPYVIKAIGNSEIMLNALNREGSFANYLNVLGLRVNIEKSENLTIPKYKGKVNFEYSRPVEQAVMGTVPLI